MDILHATEDYAVLIKPIGMDSEKDVPSALAQVLGDPVYPLHRLDKNVGGVMIYARTKKAAAHLSRVIQDGQMIKEYVAMVHGVPPEEGTWDDLLFKDSRKNKVYVVDRLRKGVKDAKLSFRRILCREDQSLVRIRLYTGRSHQIRVQFASRKFPLVGDHKYGARDEAQNPMLFSCRITFPWKGENLTYTALPPWAE